MKTKKYLVLFLLLISINSFASKASTTNTKNTQTSTNVPLVFKYTQGSEVGTVSIHPAAFTDANSSHVYTFSITKNQDFSGTLSDNSLDESDFVFSSVVLKGAGLNYNFTFSTNGSHDFETLDEVPLYTGDYVLTVNGTITAPATSGIFTGDLSLASFNTFPVPAVPEPETYAMLLAGLALMGFMSRRRKNF